jgi:uroporphyrinogen decarboxylase
MTSRERVRNVFSRKPVDRIPNGLGGCETAGLHCVAYDRIKNVLGVDDLKNRMSTFMCNSIFEPSVLDAMGGDVILLGSRMCPSRFWHDDKVTGWREMSIWDISVQVPSKWRFTRDCDGSWWWDDTRKCPPGAYYFDAIRAGVPETGVSTSAPTPDDFSPVHNLPEELLRALEEDARWLYENTEYSIWCGEYIQDLQYHGGGSEQWWMRLATDPDICGEFLDKACEAALPQLVQLDQAVGKYCDALMIAGDTGDLRGITIGPDLWRDVYKPRYKTLFAGWHTVSNMKVSMHNCGSIVDILDDLVECGVDVLNPIQTSARGMDPSELKERFGDDLILYGAAYDALSMAGKSAEAVYESVKKTIRILSCGGRYLFAGVHNLPADLSEDHLRAILQAYDDCKFESGLIEPLAK